MLEWKDLDDKEQRMLKHLRREDEAFVYGHPTCDICFELSKKGLISYTPESQDDDYVSATVKITDKGKSLIP